MITINNYSQLRPRSLYTCSEALLQMEYVIFTSDQWEAFVQELSQLSVWWCCCRRKGTYSLNLLQMRHRWNQCPRGDNERGSEPRVVTWIVFWEPHNRPQRGWPTSLFTPICNSHIIMVCVCHNIKNKCFFFNTLTETFGNSPFSDKHRRALLPVEAKICITQIS